MKAPGLVAEDPKNPQPEVRHLGCGPMPSGSQFQLSPIQRSVLDAAQCLKCSMSWSGVNETSALSALLLQWELVS